MGGAMSRKEWLWNIFGWRVSTAEMKASCKAPNIPLQNIEILKGVYFIFVRGLHNYLTYFIEHKLLR